MIHLRTLTPEDWSVWRELRLYALEDSPYAFGSKLADWENAAEERWRARLALPGSLNLVAYVSGKPVGMVTCAPFDGRYELMSMWVAPGARGSGVGDALIDGSCRWALERGARELSLAVKRDNLNAIRLYARHGFVDVGASDDLGERTMRRVLSHE